MSWPLGKWSSGKNDNGRGLEFHPSDFQNTLSTSKCLFAVPLLCILLIKPHFWKGGCLEFLIFTRLHCFEIKFFTDFLYMGDK